MIAETALFCLAINIYHEARGEPLQGQLAVAMVTLNRAKRRQDRICNEVFKPYQFSWTIGWSIQQPGVHDLKAFNKAKQVAIKALQSKQDPTGGATHYHNHTVNPAWANKLAYVGQIGNHHFYR